MENNEKEIATYLTHIDQSFKGAKGYGGDDPGPPGSQGIPYGHLETAFKFAERMFGVKKEDILLGYRKEPPEVKGYHVYIYYNGGGAEYHVFRDGHWINWSYRRC